ncbi:MAG: ABC transporter ATP-binding protein [Eubacteriaceae bacterium]|nr:ABC transporter ATP-binding protein [Eubacteriaceae bacterium]
MSILEVKGLCKDYPSFSLKDVSFSLDEGRIMGFIGRNGAGKTTTIKSMLSMVHPSAGSVKVFGLDMTENENAIKEKIGYAAGGGNFYQRKKLSRIASVIQSFYPAWDDGTFIRYMDAFGLDPQKTSRELSEGMKVKFSLACAMSHGARLLILDEPTSGLDPVSRSELLDIFSYLKEKGAAVFFSTHITSDLEKCADDITYIKHGRIIYTGTMADLISSASERGEGNTLEEIMVQSEKEDLHEKLG